MAIGLGDLDVFMHEIKNCMCEAFNDARQQFDGYPGCPCRSVVVTGAATWDICGEGGPEFLDEISNQPGHENCACGQLTVATERLYPYTSYPDNQGTFPLQQSEVPHRSDCFPSGMAADLNVTILRCATAPDEGSLTVPDEVMEQEAWVNSIDLMVMFNGIACCLSKSTIGKKQKPRRYLIQQVAPLLSDGMCVGAELRFTADLGSLCPCPEEVSP